MPSKHMEFDDRIERLKEEATKRWGTKWTVEARYFADGDAQCHAVHSLGRNDDGYLVKKRLFIRDSGEFIVDKVTLERQYITEETLESPED